MLKKVLLPFLFSLPFLATPMLGQSLDHVQGELLVKLWPDADMSIHQWMQTKRTLSGTPTGITYKKQVSAPMDIHSFTFDFTAVDEYDLLGAIQRDSRVQAVQFNHFVSLRNEPDDPQFEDQWQYINTGQSGGTPGADIDIDLAWDIATGGLTPQGDTIVVCVIDGGVDLDHPDLVDNLWVNHAEIPDNGIDDDNNGFVDDYRGWSTFSNNDNVGNNAGHGTPVTGIVGAKGDNGIGVAGVNWNVKVMFVQGGTGQESEVLEAYSYPLIARQKYNATDGAEGAFVVSTNASWGVDFGQPSNAPLWCAFYDTLGVHGILSCGATANINLNIDVQGDLPTGCSSEYLLTVTNMNHNDVKVNSAGYGIETIDLGAFGQGTWTTANNAGYGGFGGTSGATPHVAGTIALLYSAPCSNLTSIAKGNPQLAAELVRDYIFEGTDPNPSLDGITVTGGRLNVNNSMMMLMANCGPCPAPINLTVSDVIDVSATVSWVANDSTITSNIEYREMGTMDWNSVDNVASPHNLTGLAACTEYELRVAAYCANDTSFTEIVTFKTDGCCENPTQLEIVDVTETSAKVNWSSIFAAVSYNLRISEAGLGNWTEFNTTDLTYDFNGLISCTEYEVQIQVTCNGNSIGYSDSYMFLTKGCGACLDLDYCIPSAVSVDDEWIESIEVGMLANTSGANDSYGDFTAGGPTAEFATFGTYQVMLTPGYSGANFNERFRIWIDLNQDGVLDNSAERVFDSGNPAPNTATGEMTLTGNALTGPTRMRIAMSRNMGPTSCSISNTTGEIEDYCITIVEGVAPCHVPSGLLISDLMPTAATLEWGAAAGANEYIVRHKKTSETMWTENNSTSVIYNFTGLDSETEYEAQVKSLCSGGVESDYSENIVFTTPMVSSVNNLDNLQNWNVYPNPFNGTIYVDFAFAKKQSKIKVEMIDQLGRTVRQRTLENIPAGNQKVSLEANGFTDGIYFIRLTDENGNSLSEKILRSGN